MCLSRFRHLFQIDEIPSLELWTHRVFGGTDREVPKRALILFVDRSEFWTMGAVVPLDNAQPDQKRETGSRIPVVSSSLPHQSCSTTLKRELLTWRPPLYLMNPSFLNLFIKKFTRGRVVPTISASVS
jgi:hypothetical protein